MHVVKLFVSMCRLSELFRKHWHTCGQPPRETGRATNKVAEGHTMSYGQYR